MPRIDHRDEDGEAHYAEPEGEEGWDLDGPPEEMHMKAVCAAVARDILGCQVKWWPYYCDWVCTCDRMDHACDSQCSALAGPDQLYERVIGACQERGIALLADRHVPLLQAALTAWRKST